MSKVENLKVGDKVFIRVNEHEKMCGEETFKTYDYEYFGLVYNNGLGFNPNIIL